MNEFVAIVSIVGGFVGSGFVSGKEIVVFFAHFGGWCYPAILLSFFLLFYLLKLILNLPEKIIKDNKLIFFTIQILSIIFASSMFGSMVKILEFQGILIEMAIFLIIFAFCLLIFLKGGKFLNKINFIFVPIMLLILFSGIFFKIGKIDLDFTFEKSFGLLYGMFYIFLNCASLIPFASESGARLTQKQKARVAFVCALVLCLLLCLCSTVLLAYPQTFSEAMPFVCIFGKGQIVVKLAVFLGSLTTLLGQIYSLSQNFRFFRKNELLNFFQAVCLPFCFSLIGFNVIVSLVYPVAGVLGGVLFVELFFIPFFKRAYKKIHPCCKKT